MPRTTKPTLNDIKPPSLFVVSPHHLEAGAYQPRTIEGELVSEESAPLSFEVPGQAEVLSDAEIFRMWIGYHDTMPSGAEPVISDFLRDNPRYLGQNKANTLGGSKSTPRTWTSLCHLIQRLNSHVTVPGANGQWVAPERLVCQVVGAIPGLALLQYAKDKGLKVLSEKPKSAAPTLSSQSGPEVVW
ncbi:hypothetical protein [Pseudomonas amygdali]|uniref:Uncharacterized protein n=1 Tax=Pseudomonas amygdali pv. lachrymans str. M301315 TaxID=629260 RepID=A0AAD0PWA4_PSEAV|nr:hypothetical protein [Pseudomonas amygdali]AXH59922.1 hypothetical protein PLA107_032370 [Pseudomonas amygdali pv. lachrymans str. M301315]RMT06361.1 hypothetical protein ALP54_03791 [Pseudomonas amygdali pv. lachrymans]